MFSRPGRDDSEEDLLRFQQDFLARGSTPSANVIRVVEDAPAGNIEKRPHDRDVVHLQGNENVEVPPNPPRKKSKFKEQLGQNYKGKDEDVDAATLLDRHDTHVTVLLSKIIEKDTKNSPIVMPTVTSKGFPTVLHRNTLCASESKSNASCSKPKQSLFAQQFAKGEEMDFGISTAGQPMSYDDDDVEEDLVGDDASYGCQSIITGEGLKDHDPVGEVKKIHEENVKKLSSMSEGEIMEEQKMLKQTLDPSILKFLQEKRDHQANNPSEMAFSVTLDDDDEGIGQNGTEEMKCESMDEKPGNQSIGKDEVAKEILGTDISENWLHMDQVEPEKLEWMKNCPVPSATKSGSNEQVRFNFEGNIVISGEDIPEYIGLHHHGNEPNRAGYSLEELFLLSRSNFLQQRVFAVSTLAKIIEKDKRCIFHDKIEQAIFPVLLDAGLPFLLRWSLDNNTETLIMASVACLTAMLVSQSDESAADCLCCGWYRGNELPCLCPAFENHAQNGEAAAANLSDIDATNQDLVKGLIQMRLVPRLRYILEVIRPSSPTVLNILGILIRMVQHCTEAAHSVLKCPRLLDTILIQFVPSSWKLKGVSTLAADLYGHPLPKALKLLRVLCCAGKNIADTLVTKYGIITKILRFNTVPADQMQLDITEALELATESYRIWAICVSYGLACDVFSDAYSHIISQLQLLSSLQTTSSLSKHNSAVALLGLIEAVTHVAGSKAELQAQMTTQFSNDDTPTAVNMDASHLPPSPVDWSHVTGLLPVIGHSVQLFKDQFIALDEQLAQVESFSTLSSIFNLLASFYQTLVKQPSYSPVECLDEIEKFMVDSICVPVMSCKTMQIIFDKLCNYSSYYVNELANPRTTRVSNFLDYGCILEYNNSTKHCPRCLQDGTPFAFLLSFTRLAMVITSCHKGVTSKFAPFVMHHKIIDYLKTNSTSGRNNCESQCFFVKVEQHFQYFLVKLFYNVLLQCGPMDGQLTALYHTASLLLFSRLGPGDEYYAHDLMSTVIFNPAFFYESKDECSTSLTSDLSEMGIDPEHINDDIQVKKEKCFTRATLLSEAHKDLLSIRSTFMSSFAQMRHALAKSRARSLHQPQNITSFLLPLADGAMLPVDWMFLPIVDLHNNAVKSELMTRPSDSPRIGSCSVVKRTLQWVLLLEEWRPVILHKVSLTARIARLMCTFLCSSDLFFDNLIHNYLKTLFHSYTHPSHVPWLDFDQPIPGITSFYDLYLSFLAQYEAVSYGDTLFSSFVLLPLQQRYNEMFRKAVWSGHVTIFRSFSLPFDELPVAIEYFLDPPETNYEILTLQLRVLITRALRQNWSPVFYLVAIHHLCSFIFSKPEGKITDQKTVKIFSKKLQLLNQVLSLTDQEIRSDIISYWKPSRDIPKGFQVFTNLPATRQLLLRKHNTPEEAWEVWKQAK